MSCLNSPNNAAVPSLTDPTALRCPACGGGLVAGAPGSEASEPLTCPACRATYPVREGVLDLTHPVALAERDKQWQAGYDAMAEKYDEQLKALSLELECDLEGDRRRMAAHLDLRPGQTVLDVSTGTGANLPYLAEAMGGRGRIVAVDLSPGMLAVARRKMGAAGATGPTLHFLLANASYLPFPPGAFDAVLHVGGINEFAERRRAFAEMVRVAKPGARIVVSDEGIPWWHQDSPRGHRLIAGNSLYRREPPFEDVPWPEIEDFRLDWAGNEVFWVFAMAKRT